MSFSDTTVRATRKASNSTSKSWCRKWNDAAKDTASWFRINRPHEAQRNGARRCGETCITPWLSSGKAQGLYEWETCTAETLDATDENPSCISGIGQWNSKAATAKAEELRAGQHTDTPFPRGTSQVSYAAASRVQANGVCARIPAFVPEATCIFIRDAADGSPARSLEENPAMTVTQASSAVLTFQ